MNEPVSGWKNPQCSVNELLMEQIVEVAIMKCKFVPVTGEVKFYLFAQVTRKI